MSIIASGEKMGNMSILEQTDNGLKRMKSDHQMVDNGQENIFLSVRPNV